MRPCVLWARRAGRLAAALAAVVLVSSVYILVCTPPPERVALPPLDPAATGRVYVLAWGYHSSVFVEQPPGWRLGPEGDEDAPFVEYGWGDRRFFMESNFWPHVLFASAILPTASVVYVCGHHAPPDEEVVGGEVFVRACRADEIARLVTVLEQEMARQPDGRPAAYPARPAYPGRFYPGREYYVVWWNCNTWTVRVLRDAGFDVSPAFVVAKSQVAGRLRGFRDARKQEAT